MHQKWSPHASVNQQASSSDINVGDCLDMFARREQLGEHDKWYCSKCKDHVTANKKMEIWKAPDYLIIHFKRFSHTRNAMFGSRKINDFINFPVTSLDMAPYILSNSAENSTASAT